MDARGIVNSFEHKKSFWRLNPQFAAFEPFKSLYAKDRSKDKEASSGVMWGLAFFFDSASVLKNIPDKYKKERIKAEFGGVDLDDPAYAELVSVFASLCTSEAERAIAVWEDKMRERSEFLVEQTYALDNAEKLDKLMAATPKLFQELQRLREEVLKEASTDGKAMGGVRESAGDRGAI